MSDESATYANIDELREPQFVSKLTTGDPAMPGASKGPCYSPTDSGYRSVPRSDLMNVSAPPEPVIYGVGVRATSIYVSESGSITAVPSDPPPSAFKVVQPSPIPAAPNMEMKAKNIPPIAKIANAKKYELKTTIPMKKKSEKYHQTSTNGHDASYEEAGSICSDFSSPSYTSRSSEKSHKSSPKQLRRNRTNSFETLNSMPEDFGLER